MHFYPADRVALFIDGINTYSAARALGFEIDFRRLKAVFATRCQLIRVYYYTTLIEDDGASPVRPLVDWLEYNGFTVKTRTVRDPADPSLLPRMRRSLRMELAMDAMTVAPALDHIVLLSGDGEFTPLVAALKNHGRRVSVVSTLATHPPMVSDDLRRVTDHFIDLADLETEIDRSRERTEESVSKSGRKDLQYLDD